MYTAEKPRIRILWSELNNIPQGKVESEAKNRIIHLLADCWDELQGGDETSMTRFKLHRAEELSWNPPVLSFVIERHGATVLGSSRAELHKWHVNLHDGTAYCQRGSYRQLYPTSPRLNVKPIAARVYEAVKQGTASNCDLLKQGIVVWNGDDQVSVKHGMLIPGHGYPQTVAGRRKRFRNELQNLMKTLGWQLVSVKRAMTFERH
jgi:hypothetical protein